ncbi:MAG TPA: PAS domain-containing methyl-accepting chemotaxis protein [Hyphomonadaceae bacterium]|nr:PAS domain-containing methyl-accepting chemotaxis protein [Hyphomonadaceae bacterium]
MFSALKARPTASVLPLHAVLPAPEEGRDLHGMVKALDRVMAVIEFNPDGTIITANANFSSAMGYALDEIQGRHHRMFADPAYAASDAYRRFWEGLTRGEFVSGEFKRFAKGNREIWLQASYNPILDASGRVARVVKFATDITEQKMRTTDATGQLEAINRSQAVIEFNLDGTIINANPNFCAAMGYQLADIKGRHHRMFVEPAYASSLEYQHFWESLRRGEFQAAEYKRFANGGRPIWIQATYNPIRNADGVPMKVVKYATDITAMVEKRMRNEKLAAEIESDLSGIADNISAVSRQASDVSQAVTETSETIQNVAAAAEELTASINEISSSVSASKRSAEEASKLTQSADASTAALTKTAEQMTGIVELIDDIASQINLLALNATIESARAGEAGRGFAVVAAEVKQLAAQVSAATKTISTEIHGVQSVSAEVVSSLKAIQGSVSTISGSIAEVAAAVAQQTSATGEISATMQAASSSVSAIDKGVSTMAGSMSQAAHSTEQVRGNMAVLVK